MCQRAQVNNFFTAFLYMQKDVRKIFEQLYFVSLRGGRKLEKSPQRDEKRIVKLIEGGEMKKLTAEILSQR